MKYSKMTDREISDSISAELAKIKELRDTLEIRVDTCAELSLEMIDRLNESPNNPNPRLVRFWADKWSGFTFAGRLISEINVYINHP